MLEVAFVSYIFLVPHLKGQESPHEWEEEAYKVRMIAPTQIETEAHKVKRVAYTQRSGSLGNWVMFMGLPINRATPFFSLFVLFEIVKGTI